MLNVGVVGCGYWGSKHVRVLQGMPGVSRVTAIDPSEDRLQSLKQAFPGIATYRSLASALGHVDAVVIATPPRTHARLALIAMEAGKSVLVEKPLATDIKDAHILAEEAAARSLVLMVGHTFEYNAAVWKLKELVQSNELGRIYYMDSARLNLGLYQSDVNVIWDLAPHDVSIFNYILQATPVSVQAWGSRHGHRSLEDVAYLRLLYADPEVTATARVSWLDPCKVRRTTVVGSNKMAVYNDLASEPIRIFDKGLVPPEEVGEPQDIPMSYRYGDIRAPHVLFEEPLNVQDREFVSCVAEGRQSRTSADNGMAVVRVLEAANLSLETGTPVELDHVPGLGGRGPQLVKAS